jgi:hypothetical protein
LKENLKKILIVVVILMTGHERESVKRLIQNSAVDLVLFKPFDLLKIVKILKEPRTPRETETAGYHLLKEA